MVSDDDGNFNTFPLSTLESDINSNINSQIANVNSEITKLRNDMNAGLASKQPTGDYLANNSRVSIQSGILSGCGDGKSKYMMNGCGDEFEINGKWYSAVLMDNEPTKPPHQDAYQWYIKRF